MKRRIAYKVANAIAIGTSHHNPETRRRALVVVGRDLNHGRLDGVLMSHHLGHIEVGEWYRVNIGEPIMKAAAGVSKAMETMAVQVRRMMDNIARDLSRVKIPRVYFRVEPREVQLYEGTEPLPPWVTLNQAATALGVHTTTIGRRLKRGTYEGARAEDGTWMITDSAVIAAVANDLDGD